MPNVEISPANEVTFNTLRYEEPQTRSLTVRNVGPVVAEFTFLIKPDVDAVCKSWLKISPQQGLILPGESDTITFTVLVDRSNAEALNFSEDDLTDVLVLSLSNGRDIFLSARAPSFRPTCFGNALAALAQMSKPIRSLDMQARTKAAHDAKTLPSAGLKVPSEISRLTDFLSTHALAVVRFWDPGFDCALTTHRTIFSWLRATHCL